MQSRLSLHGSLAKLDLHHFMTSTSTCRNSKRRRKENFFHNRAGEELSKDITDRDPLGDNNHNHDLDFNNTNNRFTEEAGADLQQILTEFDASQPTKSPKVSKTIAAFN